MTNSEAHTPNARILDSTPEGYELRRALSPRDRIRLYDAKRKHDWAVLAEFTGEDIGID